MFGFKKPAPVVTHDSIKERVESGASLLDAQTPGWHNKINTSTLDVARNDRCVLGQMYGSYTFGVLKVFGFHVRRNVSREHGFDAMREASTLAEQIEVDREFRFITQAWREEIEARRETTPV